jgi:hypothetical protein
MEKIKSKDRRKVLIKVGILLAVPIPALLVLVLLGLIGRPASLHTPEAEGSKASYIEERVYPTVHESTQTINVTYEGHTSVVSGSTLLWSGEIDIEGLHQPNGSGQRPSYTLYSIPIYFHALPMFRNKWAEHLVQSSMIDMTGFLGPEGTTYSIGIRSPDGKWYDSQWEITSSEGAARTLALKGVDPVLKKWNDITGTGAEILEIYFLGAGRSIVGRAGYDATNGLMVYAVSFAGNGASLTLESDNLPRNKFNAMLLPFMLGAVVALSFYEIFWSSVKAERQGKGMPVEVEFAILGYTAVLVDLYYDYIYYANASPALSVLIHAGLIALMWHRLGWWALLPLVELGLALFNAVFLDSMQLTFTCFPGAVGAWLLALMIQGTLSPGQRPKALTPKARD